MRRFLTGPAAILTVVCLIAGCTSSDDTADETTTAAPATTVAPPETATTVAATTSTTLSETAAIAAVQALQDAYNAYDPDAALPLFVEKANDDGHYPGDLTWYRFHFDGPEVVGTQGTLSECRVYDDGEVRCAKTWTDTLLSGKAGIVYSGFEAFHLSDEGLITFRMPREAPDGVEANQAFEEALGEWMAIAHPEAHERFYVPALETTNAETWRSPEGVAELSPLIDEFVAQSDDYPLSG